VTFFHISYTRSGAKPPLPVGCTILHGSPPAPVSSTHTYRVSFIISISSRSQLGLGLGLLQDGLHLGGLHDVALDLELAGHEQALGVGLAADETGEVGIGQGEGDYMGFEICRLASLV
jgi:hypothetical protein